MAPVTMIFYRETLHGNPTKPERPPNIPAGDNWDPQPDVMAVYTNGTHKLTLHADTWEDAEMIASNTCVTVLATPLIDAPASRA